MTGGGGLRDGPARNRPSSLIQGGPYAAGMTIYDKGTGTIKF
jgi:hypothetical protein